MTKPSLPQGTRDFAAATVYKRNYILNCNINKRASIDQPLGLIMDSNDFETHQLNYMKNRMKRITLNNGKGVKLEGLDIDNNLLTRHPSLMVQRPNEEV